MKNHLSTLTIYATFVALVLAGAIQGCGQTAPEHNHLIGLYLSSTSVSLQVGSTVDLVATGFYSDGSTQSENVAWTSSDWAVASIDALGRVTAVGAGIANVTAMPSEPLLVRSVQILVADPRPDAPVITLLTLPGARYAQNYSAQITKTGGLDPCVWTMASGTLPTGLALDGTTGLISGRSYQVSFFQFTIRVTDALGRSDDQAYSLSLAPPVPPPPPPPRF